MATNPDMLSHGQQGRGVTVPLANQANVAANQAANAACRHLALNPGGRGPGAGLGR